MIVADPEPDQILVRTVQELVVDHAGKACAFSKHRAALPSPRTRAAEWQRQRRQSSRPTTQPFRAVAASRCTAGGRRCLMTAAAASEACRRSIRHPRLGSAAANGRLGPRTPDRQRPGKRRRRGGGGVKAADGDSLRPIRQLLYGTWEGRVPIH
jgi:hypothetical protein